MVNREMGDFGWLISTTRSFYFNNLFVIDYYIIAIFMTKVREKFITCWTCFAKKQKLSPQVLSDSAYKIHKQEKWGKNLVLSSYDVNVDQMKKNVREQFYAGFFIWIYIFQPIFWINCSSPPAKNLCKNVHFYFLGNKWG